MAKAWRNESAAKINQRRKDGSKEPSARQQAKAKQIKVPLRGSGNYLLDGLLIKEGYVLPDFGPTPILNAGVDLGKPQGWFKRIVNRLFK